MLRMCTFLQSVIDPFTLKLEEEKTNQNQAEGKKS